MSDIESIIATASGIDMGSEGGGVDSGGEGTEGGGEAVVESPESPDTPEATDGTTEETVAPKSAETPTEPIVPQAETEADKLLAAEGIQAKGKNGKDNAIPYSRVRSIVDNAKKKWEAEQGGQIKDLRAQVENFNAVEQIITSDPDRFMAMLAEQVPAYKKYLGGAAPAEAKPGQTVPTAGADSAADPMPGPDYDLGNGARTYSPEGLTKLLEWQAKRVEASVRASIDKEYKPVRDNFEQSRKREAMEAQVNKVMADAVTWPGFTENEAEIFRTFEADKSLTLRDAYIKVVPAKFKADRESIEKEVRAKVLEELKAAPATTSVPATVTAPKGEQGGERSIEQIIRESIRGKK